MSIRAMCRYTYLFVHTCTQSYANTFANLDKIQSSGKIQSVKSSEVHKNKHGSNSNQRPLAAPTSQTPHTIFIPLKDCFT